MEHIPTHIPDAVAMITAMTAFVAAVGAAISAILSAKNGRKIDDVHAATNGMKDALVKSNGDNMYAKGVKHGEDNPRRVPKRTPKIKRKIKRRPQ